MWKPAIFVLSLSLYTGLVHYLVEHHYIVKESQETFMVGGILVIGYALLKVLQSRLMKTLEGHMDHDRIVTLRYFLDVGYFLIWGVLLVTFLGAGFKNLVLGGAILSALAGIVAQNSLTNIFAGIVLAATHPFRVGEKVSFVAWQYPRLAATYPHALVSPEHRGTVLEIGKIYTRLEGEDGRDMLVPNNIMLQAMVLRNDGLQEKPLRLYADLPTDIDLDSLKSRLASLSSVEERLVGPVELIPHTMTPSALTVEIRTKWKGDELLDANRVLFSALRPLALRSRGSEPS